MSILTHPAPTLMEELQRLLPVYIIWTEIKESGVAMRDSFPGEGEEGVRIMTNT